MFGKLPPADRNYGNKQYPIAKPKKNTTENKITY